MDILNDELERMATNVAQYMGPESASEIPLEDISGLPTHQQEPAVRHDRPKKHPRASIANVSYLMKLSGPLSTAAQVQAAAGLPTTPAIMDGTSDEGEPAKFCRLSQAATQTIKTWLSETGIPHRDRPTFIRLALSAKDPSPHSPCPTLSLDTTLPQHRPNNTTDEFHPLQNEWPVWYFFYGTLADPDKLVGMLGLSEDEFPVLERATVKGGFVRTWGGEYKVIVDGSETVRGWAYEVRTKEHEDVLRTYESERNEGKGGVWGCVFRCADVGALIE